MKSAVEQIKERLPIIDVLSSYITIQQSGSTYKAKCPFHNEKTASFSISPEKGLYYCFGCGAKGDIFDFVSAFEGLDFKGALKVLASRAHVELTGAFVPKEKNDPLYDVHEWATVFYEEKLTHEKAVKQYLYERGLTDKTISEFRIGYTPNEWRSLATTLAPSTRAVAEKAGLIKQTEKGYYDRFRGRIMFPLFDASSRVIGFSGRLFGEAQKEGGTPAPKYLNSPETELFHKSDVLYGFHAAKFAVKKNNFSVLVEGQMDLLLSHQAGFKNTVATSGTAVSEEALKNAGSHLCALARLSPNIILAFDGDEAGQKAMTRAVLVLLALGMNPKVARLPEGKDPADILKEEGGTDVWRTILKESVPFITYQTMEIMRKNPSPHTLSRELRTLVFPYLAKIDAKITQASFFESISRETGIPLQYIASDFASYEQSLGIPSKEEVVKMVEKSFSPYERFIAILGTFTQRDKQAFEDLLMEITFYDEVFSAPPLLPEKQAALPLLFQREYQTLDIEELKKVATELMHAMAQSFYKEVQKKLSLELMRAERDKNEVRTTELLERLKELHDRIKG